MNSKSASKKSSTERTNEVYSSLLEILDLTPEHKEQLGARGFSTEDIQANGYRSLPLKRSHIAEQLAKKFNEDLSGVAGFWRNEKGSWELAGKSGILIPVRDEGGNIVALKCRVDKPSSPSSKYLLISSNPQPDKKTGEVKHPNGTSAVAAVHWPRERGAGGNGVLRITEGEIKADIATTFTNITTLSIPGVAMWRMAVEIVKRLKPETVLLAFDSDKGKAIADVEGGQAQAYGGWKKESEESAWSTAPSAEDFVVGKALASLYSALKEAGVKVVIEDWPAEAGKGIDDVLVAGKTDAIRQMPMDEADKFIKEMLTAELPEDWVYVVGTKRFVHAKTLIEIDKEQFRDRYCHEVKGDPALRALSNPAFQKTDLPTYTPAREIIYSEGDKKYFNLWRPNTDLAPKAGSVDKFLTHCEYMIPDEAERGVMLDWLAFNVQNPGKKILWALMLQGLQGTGKSYIGWIMKMILGAHNVSTPTNEAVHEVYTAWQKKAQLIIIEEVMARGRLELMNKLKPMITESTTTVREMHKPAYEQANVFNILMFTNHEDAILIDKTDRRYCIIFSPAAVKEGGYYEKLWNWSRENIGFIWQFMLDRDLSKFKHLGHAPMTHGKKEVIAMSSPPLLAWVMDCIENELWPFSSDLVSTSHLMDVLPANLRHNTSLQGLGRALQAAGGRQLGQVRLTSGSQIRAWSVRRHEVWASAEKETLVHEYEKWSASAVPGGRVEHNPIAEARPY